MNFPSAYGHERLDDFRTVIDYLDPDVLVVQEIQSEAGAFMFLDSVLNHGHEDYGAAPFHDGFDSDNEIFYRTGLFNLEGQWFLATPHRDIARYDLSVKETGRTLHVFSVHLKSSPGSDNEAIRLQEATVLRRCLDSLALQEPANAVVAGDFNFYCREPAYECLTSPQGQVCGRLYDPASAITSDTFHDNQDIAALHTQSTRYDALPDSGASGGLDDRFDMILCSRTLLDSTGMYLVKNTYTACGNDGQHFDRAVNYQFNQAVPVQVADALYNASDHLPLHVVILDSPQADENDKKLLVTPNPMNTSTRVILPGFDDFRSAEIVITNIFGKKILTAPVRDSCISIDNRDRKFACGIYFVRVTIYTEFSCHRYLAKLAVVY